jgi:hypothetical protein
MGMAMQHRPGYEPAHRMSNNHDASGRLGHFDLDTTRELIRRNLDTLGPHIWKFTDLNVPEILTGAQAFK